MDMNGKHATALYPASNFAVPYPSDAKWKEQSASAKLHEIIILHNKDQRIAIARDSNFGRHSDSVGGSSV